MRIGDIYYPILVENIDEIIPGDLSHLEESLRDAGFDVWPPVERLRLDKPYRSYVDKKGQLVKGFLASGSPTSGWIMPHPTKKEIYMLSVPTENSELHEFARNYQPIPAETPTLKPSN